jgi:hypothetical protein
MRRLLAIAALMLAACSGENPADMRDPASVARKFVEAYNAKNLQRMLPLVDQVNLEAIGDALQGGPGSEAYNAIFAPEMVELLAKEGGKIDGPRYDRRGRRYDAVVSVGKSDLGFVYTIVLGETETGEWRIAENSSMPQEDFLALPTERKK